MAILAKKSGLMISGSVVAENDLVYVFQVVDNKHPTTVKKASKVEKVFDGDFFY